MYISQIVLSNWKAYAAATFDFPEPTTNQNIVVIGAENGFGKTSLLEAIMLGMFGRDGLSQIARSPFAIEENDRPKISYSTFLESALHQNANHEGDMFCSVKLVFMSENDERLEIHRTWHFNEAGVYRPNDEQLEIFEGSGVDRKPVKPRAVEDDGRAGWFRDYIARKLMPFTLAHYFMFDGEQLSALADRGMSAQVRAGIEGLLGIPVLRRLGRDLRAYASARYRETPNVTDEGINIVQQEIGDLETELESVSSELETAEGEQAKLKQEQESLFRELANLRGGTDGVHENPVQELNRLEGEIASDWKQLEDLILKDLTLAMSSLPLRESTKNQLISEITRSQWESSLTQGNNNLNLFLDTVAANLKDISPKFTGEQQEYILQCTRKAWEKLWYPPPQGASEFYLHSYFNEIERSIVVHRLNELDAFGAAPVIELLNKIGENEEALERLREYMSRTEAVGPDIQRISERLKKVTADLERLNQQIGALKRRIDALQSQINQKNQELGRLYGQVNQAARPTRLAQRAQKISAMVDQIVENAVPGQIEAIGCAMTDAYKKMSHKDDLSQITIDANCDVKLLNSNGVDLRTYGLSAGEKQIFTQALISAVSQVSGRVFPMVIDTPLARLDYEHRKGVLNHLAQRDFQVILLSTDTEVVGEFLDEIEPYVQKKFLIRSERIGAMSCSTVQNGYFGETGEQS